MGRRRVFVLGIDCASPDLIQNWVRRGELPTFQRLMSEGASGQLRSTIPPITPPAWTSSFTGKNPGKHNIFDFFKPSRESYKKDIVTAQDRQSHAIWNILSSHGKKVGVLNVPLTFPPEEVNGFMVTGMMTPSPDSEFTYPPSLKQELLKETPYQIGVDLRRVAEKKGPLFEDAFIQEVSEVTRQREKALFFLLNKFDWDFFVAVFEPLDSLQHFFWKYIDENHPQYPLVKKSKHRGAILDHYKELDRIIEKLLGTLDRETVFVVYSDHGSGPLYQDVFINNWLIDRGFLKLKWDVKGILWRLLRKRISFSRKIHTRQYSKLISAIDWKGTKAYFFSLSGQSIRINLKGREPEGVVEAGDLELLKAELIRALSELKDENTGEKLVEKIHQREEIYAGEFVTNAPDLIVEMKEGYVLQEGLGEKLVLPARQGSLFRSGDHRSNGILFIKGEGIRKEALLSSPEIVDMAPTLLYAMGVPVPRDMDGKVLKEVFEETYLNENPIRLSEESDLHREPAYDFSPEEADIIKKQLKGLGYME